uniref:Retrotransposon Copia-like N-terminal domain-containing protein n=1 Tax=Quercus lobata TaxID=97700 RepID=A0A7N2LE27_QUELO
MGLEPSMVSSASSTSSASSSSTSTHSSISTHGVNPSLLLLSNMASMMTVKLDYNNYLVWRHQIEVILEAYSIINFIEDNLEAPNPLLKDSSGKYTTEANSDYIQWRNCGQALFTFINSTLSPSILALTVEYDAFCSAIRSRSDVVTLEEMNTLLNAEERSIKKRMNFAYQGRHPPAKLASMAASSMDAHLGPPSNQNWLTDIVLLIILHQTWLNSLYINNLQLVRLLQ